MPNLSSPISNHRPNKPPGNLAVFQFPFTAVVGQRSFKLALILAAINPAIGGVLVSGPRGSAKSTLARGLADVMPVHSQSLASNISSPFVTLPLGATEESVLGTIDLQQVLQEKTVEFQAGLLAKADGGILYVDEVNLLADHLVDLLLDVSASGVNVVERDGVSHSHRSRFVLLGTMNPDEGELRPQLQDRFGLAVELSGQYSIQERMDIVRLREQFEASTDAFIQQCAQAQAQLRSRIVQAREQLIQVECADEWREQIAIRCVGANVDGVRADIVWHRAAVAHAAWQQRNAVTEEDIIAVEELVLAHRRQPDNNSNNSPGHSSNSSPSNSLANPSTNPSNRQSPYLRPPENKLSQSSTSSSHEETEGEGEGSAKDQQTAGDWGSMKPVEQAASATEYKSIVKQVSALMPAKNKSVSTSQLSNALASKKTGVALGGGKASQQKKYSNKKVHWFNSLLENMGEWPLKTFRYHAEKSHQPVLHLCLLDTSASTLQDQWFAQAKASLLSIAKQIYIDREQLMVMGFGNQQVEVLLPQRRAPKTFKTWLDNVRAGGGTPLRDVIQQAYRFQQQQLQRLPELHIKTYLVTDGRTSQSVNDLQLLGDVVVIDIESSLVKRGKAQQIASVLQAHYLPLMT
jgi:magnesium chelatase subunit D